MVMKRRRWWRSVEAAFEHTELERRVGRGAVRRSSFETPLKSGGALYPGAKSSVCRVLGEYPAC
jgi:hypothetical protein